MVKRFFNGIRSRPVHERRIIGVATYLAIAAVILAVWIKSFPGMLADATTGASGDKVAVSGDAGNGGKQGLASPFAALKQSVHDLGQGISQLKQSFQNGMNGASSSEISGMNESAQGSILQGEVAGASAEGSQSSDSAETTSTSGEISTQVEAFPSATVLPTAAPAKGFWASIGDAANGFFQSIADAVRAL